MTQMAFSKVRIVVVALATIVGVNVATASAESASSSAAPGLRFCLRYANGTPYATKPVYLYWWDGRQARYWKAGRTGADGCGTFRDVVPSVYYTVQGYWTYTVGSTVYAWNGATDWTAVGREGLFTAPTGVVSQRVLYR